MRQFRVWCPEFSEVESDGALYETAIMYDAVEQYLDDHTDGEDEAAAAGGREFKVCVRRHGKTSSGDLFPVITYNMTGDYSFSWYGDVADDIPDEDIRASAGGENQNDSQDGTILAPAE